MTDDGFNVGVLYSGDRSPYRPQQAPLVKPAELEKEFAL